MARISTRKIKKSPKRSFLNIYLVLILPIIAFILFFVLIIHEFTRDRSPQFFPLDDSQAIYTITKHCPMGQGWQPQTNLAQDDAYCVEYVGDHVFDKEHHQNSRFFSVTVGKSDVDLSPYIGQTVTNIQGEFVSSNEQCIQSNCQDIGGPWVVLDIKSLQPLRPASAIEGIPCTGNPVVDKETGFQIYCPPNLTMYTYKSEYHNYNQQQEKMIFFCETPISTTDSNGYYVCPSGGVMVWANGDGWGGGCQESDVEDIQVDGQKKSVCMFQDFFTQLYVGDVYIEQNQSRYLLQGSFSKTFTKEKAIQMIESFKTLQP